MIGRVDPPSKCVKLNEPMPKPNEVRITTAVDVPPMVHAKLLPLATTWAYNDRDDLPSDQRNWRSYGLRPRWPMWPLQAKSWRVVPGGIAFNLPGWGAADRAIATFKAAAQAPKMWDLEKGAIRRAAYLSYTDEGWVLQARFWRKEGLVERSTRSGFKVWEPKRRAKRRWRAAPADYPRDKWGRVLSAKQAARRAAASTAGDT